MSLPSYVFVLLWRQTLRALFPLFLSVVMTKSIRPERDCFFLAVGRGREILLDPPWYSSYQTIQPITAVSNLWKKSVLETSYSFDYPCITCYCMNVVFTKCLATKQVSSILTLNNALIILYFIAPLGNDDPSLARFYYSARV